MLEPKSDIARVDAESLILLRRAIGSGWDIPSMALENGAKICTRILADSNSTGRDICRAVDLLNRLRDSNIAAAVALDRIERLNGGQATENFRFGPIEL